ncbi:hypothetical protein UFOVP1254_79 [uncultured Caudovirales phage]|uniref:Uncharacterized protein n=1 Tax=uncultured Caudovirales phage TaxID=2100421 RepID=A0A6J5RJV9_9CAUD|nr:hypothetical protein UFOVP1254_79 [uncultured Caudovirales phage]
MTIVQIAIFLLGTGMVWLASDPRPAHRVAGCLCGLVSQPLWLYATFVAAQWGGFAMCFVFTAVWIRNLRNNWKLLP